MCYEYLPSPWTRHTDLPSESREASLCALSMGTGGTIDDDDDDEGGDSDDPADSGSGSFQVRG